MDFVRVRHPQTGSETRVAAYQYEQHLAPLGFTLVGEEAENASDATETPDASQEGAGAATAGTDGGEGDGAGDDLLADLVGQPLAVALRARRLGTPDEVRAASDEELLTVDGVGPARLEKLRAYAVAATTEEATE